MFIILQEVKQKSMAYGKNVGGKRKYLLLDHQIYGMITPVFYKKRKDSCYYE